MGGIRGTTSRRTIIYYPARQRRSLYHIHTRLHRYSPPYNHCANTIEMETSNPAQMNTITSSLSAEEQKLLHSIVEQAKRNLIEQQEKASELSLNGD